MRALGVALGGLLAAVACGGASSKDSSPSAGGSGSAGAPAAGAAATGGSSGATEGGAAGEAVGSAGAPGGSGGSGFTSSGEQECTFDADCRVIETCCACAPAPTSAEAGECDVTCEQSACGARGFSEPAAVCRGNRCVFDLSCEQATVTCPALPPACPEGQLPSVAGDCWGPCLAPTECSAIGDCEDCPAGPNQLCVRSDLTLPQCVEITAACAENPSCECVAACFAQCNDTNGIGCFCVDC